jgi:hypothetical protein
MPLRHIWDFVVAVLRQWGALVTGGVVVAAIAVYEHISGRPIAGRPFLIAVIISLLVAFFLAWRKERLTVERLKNRGSKREVAEKLAEFLTDGEHWQRVCENPKLEIFPGDQISLWSNKLDNYLTSKLGNAYAVRVKSANGILPLVAELAPGVQQDVWWEIHVRCVRLNQFIEELSR